MRCAPRAGNRPVQPRGGARGHLQENQRLAPTIVGALGIVYGDIGTSPLYAFKESLHAAGGARRIRRLKSSACCR